MRRYPAPMVISSSSVVKMRISCSGQRNAARKNRAEIRVTYRMAVHRQYRAFPSSPFPQYWAIRMPAAPVTVVTNSDSTKEI